MKKLLSAIVVAAIILALYFSFGNRIVSFIKGDASSLNLIVITVDTVRADRLGCYGFQKNTTPAIDAFSEKSLLFENAIVPLPLTGPSHSTIFTGKSIINHGVIGNGYKLSNENVTLAEILKEKGYATAAFIASKVLEREHNYSQGFDVYSGGEVFERRADVVRKDFLDWLEANSGKKFFSWVHFYDAHCPYYAPDKFREEFRGGYEGELNTAWKCDKAQYSRMNLSDDDIEYIKSMYEAEIAYIDSNIKKILDAIDDKGLLKDTVIVITADHGESLYEEGKFGHDRCLKDYEINVPLIVYYPKMKRAGEREISQVASISIMPTILDIMKIPFNGKIDGKSFFSLLAGGDGGDESAFSVRVVKSEDGLQMIEHSLRTAKWKVIVKPHGEELYNLSDDPGETDNLIAEKSELKEVHPLFDKLYSVIEIDKEMMKGKKQKISQKTVRDLKALGYLQ